MANKSSMTREAASSIQSAANRNQNSGSFKSSFYQRAQSAAAKGKGGWPSTEPGKPSGGGRDNNPPKK